MTTIKADWRGWTVAASDRCKEFVFTPYATPPPRSVLAPTASRRTTISASVEVRLASGALSPRALVGGRLTMQPGMKLQVQVMGSGPIRVHGPSQPSLLGVGLIKGLPEEFRPIVEETLLSSPFVSGALVVVAAGYDPVDSSIFAFKHAARLLASVLRQRASGGVVDRGSLVAEVRTW